MNNRQSRASRYALAALLGAIAGGVLVASVTNALPNVIERMMSRIRRKMFEHMRQSGIEPANI